MTTPRTVHLGYEVGTGQPVEIPLKHMAICGQTQDSGKTTTLEALIARSGLRAVTFVTKRGEGSFTQARRIRPYFREQADWQYVAAVLEASRGERLKFERPWIIRATKGARTLGDVHANVKAALADPKIRGMSSDVYLTLDAYLSVVVPTIQRVRWAPSLDLAAGVNAVDLTDVPPEMQHLVIKSSIDWVLEREQGIVVVIPEAWKFIPQGRGTPVKLAAEAFIRQGAALGNYLWLDSQDLGGIEKTILRSVAVWILGVQREANEIKRTLDNLPANSPRLKAADIATLELGQFYACHGRHAVRTYVQPIWVTDAAAERVARGLDPLAGNPRTDRPRHIATPEDPTVTHAEAARLTQENAMLRDELDRYKGMNEKLAERIAALEQKGARHDAAAPVHSGNARPTRQPDDRTGDRLDVRPAASAPGVVTAAFSAAGATMFLAAQTNVDGEALYQAVKARLIDEAPALIRLLVEKPSVTVTVQRPVLDFEPHSMKWRIVRLASTGFFTEPRGCGAIRTALKRTGPDCNTANIGRSMDDLVKAGVFTDEGSGYRAVLGITFREVEA